MKCPKCNSENVQVQPKEYKPKFTVPILMVGGGFGLVFGGPIGLLVGLILGGIVAAIVHAMTPQTYRPVVVCQQCGFVGTHTTMNHVASNPLFCTQEDCNLSIVRTVGSVGSVLRMGVKIDNFPPFEVSNGDIKFLRLEPGTHGVTYYQVDGFGKDKRNGFVDIVIDGNKQTMYFQFLPDRLEVTIV